MLTNMDTKTTELDKRIMKSSDTPLLLKPIIESLSSTDTNNTAATHPDYREKLPARMEKSVQEHPSETLRRSERSNKGQRTHDKSFVDSRYVEFDNDVELMNTRRSYEIDE